MNNQELPPGGFRQPLSPQLRFCSNQNHPPRRTSLQRALAQPLAPPPPPPPPPLKELISNPSSVSVPTIWCSDYVVSSRSSYLSKDKLLREMFPRMVHYRSFNSKDSQTDSDLNVFMQGIEILGPPLDYWLTFPLQEEPVNFNNQEIKEVSGLPEEEEEADYVKDVSGWRIGPMKSTRKMLTTDVGVGKLPADDRLAFPWATNFTSTNLLPLDHMLMLDENYNNKRIEGFMECIKCGKIYGMAYLLPARFQVVVQHIYNNMDEFIKDSSRILDECRFDCACDGKLRPIIHENPMKINWLFLFYGLNLGLCTEEQLRYFCKQRNPSRINVNKNQLVRFVFLDICAQIDPDSTIRDAIAAGAAF